MEERKWVSRILVHVARSIREDKPIKKERIIKDVLDQCFADVSEPERQRWQKVVAARLDHLLSEEDDQLPLITKLDEICERCREGGERCADACPTGALTHLEEGCEIDDELCVECGHCIDACISGAIVARSDFADVAFMLAETDKAPVYAILAPAFAGQFSQVTPQAIKGVFCRLGFTDAYEVAMAADIITMQEAESYIERMDRGEPFMITSCCCPAFVKLVEKIRPKLVDMVSLSVSPMITMGRLLKQREPDCRVVFIGPCVAKKAEARLEDLRDAIDRVLTFKETMALFEAAGIEISPEYEKEWDDASHDGRIYAHTHGVTEAIVRAIRARRPDLEIRTVAGNGLKECNMLLKKAEEGNFEATFMEGMGCPGGCIGGPGTLEPVEKAHGRIDRFAVEAPVKESFRNNKAYEWWREYGRQAELFSRKADLPPGRAEKRDGKKAETKTGIRT